MHVDWRAAFAAACLGAATPALRAQAPVSAETCVPCHGPGGQSRQAGMPSLAAQPKVFLENQLVLIREGLREVPAMVPVVKGLSDEDIVALARHYAALPAPPVAAAVVPARREAGTALSKRLLCGTCHLPGYVGQSQVPRLAGQDEAFLLASMRQFRDHPGPGRDTNMSSTLRGLSDAELADLAHYLSRHPGTP